MNIFQEAKTILDKDGKVNPLGPYGKMKLTGREVSTYFRRNKVSDATIKKAVEVAIDMGGAMDIAGKEIQKFFGREVRNSKEVKKALQYANEETFRDDLNLLDEKFKPYTDKVYSRCVDFYIQFRGGKGDRITSEENKKDFETAKKMIDAYCRTNKIKQKPVYSTPQEGSSAYKVGLMIDPNYSKSGDYKNGVDLQPLYVSLSKLKTAEDHGGGWDQVDTEFARNMYTKESIDENFRALAKHGMGTETPKSVKVGTEIDYYQKDGAKYMGKVVKMDRQSYTVKDDKTNKTHQFFYHDRIKAKQLLKKKDKLSNIIKKNTIKKGKFAGYMTDEIDARHEEHEEAKGMAIKSVMDTYRNMWEDDLKEEAGKVYKDGEWRTPESVKKQKEKERESHKGKVYRDGQYRTPDQIKRQQQNEDDDGADWKKKSQSDMTDKQKDMLKKERELNLRRMKPTDKSKEFAKSEREKNLKRLEKQRNALALRKHKDAEHGKKHDSSSDTSEANQFDTYKHLVDEWKNDDVFAEEMITYRVKGMQRPEEQKFQQSAKMMKLKITMNKGKDDTLIVMSGTKKKLRDFDAVARGKSSYGDPSTVTHFDEK